MLAASALAALALLSPASPASAHDELISTDPAADAVLEALPADVTLTFSAELLGEAGSNIVEVSDAAGTVLSEGPAILDGRNAIQQLTGTATGPVRVLWRVVSSDGHPISGEFSFTVEAPATPTTPPAAESTSPSPEQTMTTMTGPDESAAPSPAPDADASDAGPLPWIVGGVVLLLLVGAIVAVVVSRRRGSGDGSTGNGTGTAS